MGGNLTQTAAEIIQSTMLQLGVPTNEQIKFEAWMMAFLRGFRQDCASGMPDRDETKTYLFPTKGYNVVTLPEACFEVIAIGTQLGRYIKPLALASTITTAKPRRTYGLVPGSNYNSNWAWNGGAGAYGWGWGLTNNQGMMAYGNGGDYGDYNIDWATKTLVTSPTFAFNNIVVKYFTNCLEPSSQTCVHPFFISAAEYYLMWKYNLLRGDLAMAREFEQQYLKEYQEQLIRKNRLGRATIVKIIDRIRGYRT